MAESGVIWNGDLVTLLTRFNEDNVAIVIELIDVVIFAPLTTIRHYNRRQDGLAAIDLRIRHLQVFLLLINRHG